jgi:hypothetical protein
MSATGSPDGSFSHRSATSNIRPPIRSISFIASPLRSSK